MKNIKFRIWDKRENRMNYLRKFMVLHNGYALGFVKDKEIYIDDYESENEQDLYEVMEFTGLYDRSGKEIYEGDIVDNPNDEFTYVIMWNKDDARFTLGVGGHDLSSYRLPDFWEVIGNIYENPNLLTKKDGH